VDRVVRLLSLEIEMLALILEVFFGIPNGGW
jgi:hypothetical protein